MSFCKPLGYFPPNYRELADPGFFLEGGGGENSNIKVMGVVVGNFEKNPYKVPELQACFVGVARTIFYP